MRLILSILRTAHAWSGATLSLLLVVLGLTGALLTFKNDFTRLTLPEARAEAPADPAVIGAGLDVLEAEYGDELNYVVLAGPNLGVHRAYLDGDRYAYADASGQTVASWTGTGRIEEWVYELHHFLLVRERGMYVAAIAALAACILVLTGLIVWAPLWRATRLRLWPASFKRPHLIAAHRNLGVVFAVPIFIFCLTGAAMIFYQTTQTWLVQLMPGPEPETFFPPVDPGDIDWPAALAAAQSEYPDAELRAVVWPAFPVDPARVRMRQPGEWTPDGRTTVLIDPSTSRVIGSVDAQALGQGRRVNNAIYPVHTAYVGGALYDAVTALSGLALALLGGFGLWSFLIKPRRRRAKDASKAATGLK